MDNENNNFTTLEMNILKAKGLDREGFEKLLELGVRCVDDFRAVRDAKTFQELTGLELEIAQNIMRWAVGDSASSEATTENPAKETVLRTDDGVYCFYCDAKQPQDYHSGDLCTKCGKQAEPTSTCHWCGSSGPGKFCRRCGAEFVPVAELELAVLLRNEGHDKNEITDMLRDMSKPDKATLWERARR